MVKCVYIQGELETRDQAGLFGSHEVSDTRSVDGEALAAQIERACDELERNGYRVEGVVPKTNGQYSGYAGWSYTAGVFVLARREEPSAA